ncbi:hypothetical protein [Streptomyces sp. 3N207]|uniref:hypothetical protein n=1 Tax=Streptomyces sp. 3N207 TaxID=3457417 RepID=UPI003FD52304
MTTAMPPGPHRQAPAASGLHTAREDRGDEECRAESDGESNIIGYVQFEDCRCGVSCPAVGLAGLMQPFPDPRPGDDGVTGCPPIRVADGPCQRAAALSDIVRSGR